MIEQVKLLVLLFMISFYYTSFENQMVDAEFQYLLSCLPADLKIKVLKFRRWQDSYASLFGKLLLKKGLEDLGFTPDLNMLKYNTYNRPYFDLSIDFNISHSGSYVICAFSTEGTVGIDIEKISPIEISDFQSQWTEQEWKGIWQAENPLEQFYRFWTIKEAVIKADGRGLSIPLKNLMIKDDEVDCEGLCYKLKEVQLDKDYFCYAASKSPIGSIQEIHKVGMEDFLSIC